MYSELQSYIESQLVGNGFQPFLFVLLVLGGFLASLLPCVYPLYPITAGILKSRTDKIRWLHPIIYYFGLASMYLIFGIIAGFTGGIFNSILRHPETNLFLAYVLFVLALSSAEFLHLPIFTQRSTNHNSASFFGSFLLGMGAGLLSSPCVGPVVVSILLQVISSSDGSIGFLSILATALKMFAFGLGVGLPFLAIGVFGISLPKSGKWMRYVQFVLAGLILFFSYTYLQKAAGVWGWDNVTTIKAFGLWILIVIASFYIQSNSDFITIRMKKAVLIATNILLSIALFLVIAPKYSYVNSLESNPKILENEISGNLVWYRNKDEVFKKANAEGKKVFIDFYADWCTNCKEFQKLTLSDSKLNEALKENAILWKIYDTDKIFESYSLDPRYPELQIGLPFFLIVDTKENMIFKTNDYMATDEMIKNLKGN
ncbi:MAG: cytochrome c biogenesis protein CcdA [Leptospira sp.]|nr:cytochrome c biogenesis protein CcdA [Leptospira sp.]